MIELSNRRAGVRISAAEGGRLASLIVDGRELLVQRHAPEADGHPMQWGSYPMAPFAGRVRRGKFTFAGRQWSLPANLGHHAVHGYGFVQPWTIRSDDTLEFEFGPPWPFAGRVLQRFALDDTGLTCDLEVVADEPMPISIGWHPWFRRPVRLDFRPGFMHIRDNDHIATDQLTTPSEGPWDDCFCGLNSDPVLYFDHGPTVTLLSDCDHWVVYNEPAHAVCVEPQSAPPNALNLNPDVVRPGQSLARWMRYSWV